MINPLVPYVNDFQKMIPTMLGSRVRRVSDMGFPQIGYQAFKLLVHQRLHESVRQWSEKYPGVDIILIEPEPNDELMFETNIMNFTKRVDIARHGFESVTIKLAKDYDRFAEICARHGIEISATRVRRVIRHFEKERERTAALAADLGADDWRAAAAGAGLGRRSQVAGRSCRTANCQLLAKRLASAPSAAGPLRPALLIDARTWSSVAQRAAGGDDHAASLEAGRQLGAGQAGGVQPDEVGLARSGASTGRSWSALSMRVRCSITSSRRRCTSASPMRSACSTAAWVRAFTPRAGASASSSSPAEAEPTA